MTWRSFLVSLACLSGMSVAVVAQGLNLDKLSDCNTLAQVQSMLQRTVSRSCRPPHNPLEERLMSRLQITPRISACLLVSPPTNRLAGFSCVDVDSQGAREVGCFRTVDDRAVRMYRDNYDASAAYRYKKSAAGCPGTNGDASEAPNSLFPSMLSIIGKPGFGFALGFGTAKVPQTLAYHGFGAIDPAFGLSNSALEVFDMFHVQTVNKETNAIDSFGEWKFDIDDIPAESRRDFIRNFEQTSGMRLDLRVRMIAITTIHSTNSPARDRRNDLEEWQRIIGDDLKGDGFRELTARELAGTPFRNTEELRDLMLKNMPFANRDFLRRTLGPHLLFLVNDDDEDCYKVAEGMVMEPEEGVKNDRGGMGLIAFAVGRCRSDGGVSKVLDELIHQETELLEREVRHL